MYWAAVKTWCTPRKSQIWLTATACFVVIWDRIGLWDLGLEDGPKGLVDLGLEDGPVVEEDRLDPDPVMEEGVKDLVDLGLEDGPEGLVDPTGVMVVGSDWKSDTDTAPVPLAAIAFAFVCICIELLGMIEGRILFFIR